jgi:TRAP-type C4-dicarboxylate transport system substrate-binding protein
MVMKSFYFSLILLLMAIVNFLPVPAFSQQSNNVIQWKMQVAYPLHADSAQPVITWAKEMEKLTKGRLVITPIPPGAVCPTSEIVNFVERGAIDCAMSYGAYYTGAVPEANLTTNVPMGPKTIGEVWDAWNNRGLLKIFREAYSERNIYYCYFTTEPYYGYLTKEPIRTLEDFKGKKIRAGGSFGLFTQLLGASAVNIPGAELYMALKLGTIDGVLYTSTGMKDSKLNEAVKYRLFPSLNIVVADLFISQKSINKLPEDIRHILLSTTDDILLRGAMKIQFQNQMAQKWLDNHDTERIQLSPKDVKKATEMAQQVWDGIANKNERCRKGVEILREQLRDLGRL